MSCAECERRARYMAADPEMYRGEDTRCEMHQAQAREAELRNQVKGLEHRLALWQSRVAELEARQGDRPAPFPSTRRALAEVARDLWLDVDQYCQIELPPPPPDEVLRTNYHHLRWMMQQVQDHCGVWPLDKLGRWVGFVHGVLASRGKLDVEAERVRTRPIFEQAYAEDGVEKKA